MSIDRHRCFIVVCDACRADLDHGDGFIPHFDTADTAIEHALTEGWHLDADGRLYCPRCLALAFCAAEGHDFTV